jgi:hypothetical protein
MIVCLAWGSLVWNPGALPIVGDWSTDGPALPLKFARESEDGRMTLVLVDHDRPVSVLWAELEVRDIEQASEALRLREKVRFDGAIGRWPAVARQHAFDEVIGGWMNAKGSDGVVWTALRPGMRADRQSRSYVTPSLARIERHLAALPPEARVNAARYVNSAPEQIATPYRPALGLMLTDASSVANP